MIARFEGTTLILNSENQEEATHLTILGDALETLDSPTVTILHQYDAVNLETQLEMTVKTGLAPRQKHGHKSPARSFKKTTKNPKAAPPKKTKSLRPKTAQIAPPPTTNEPDTEPLREAREADPDDVM